MKYIVLAGRTLDPAIFLMSAPAATIAYSAGTGVPLASLAVPLSGAIALLGGLSILPGFKARYGAWLIVIFLVPVTFMIHNFWTVTEPMMRQMQQINFTKNLSMLGAALLIAHFGPGSLSVDKKYIFPRSGPVAEFIRLPHQSAGARFSVKPP